MPVGTTSALLLQIFCIINRHYVLFSEKVAHFCIPQGLESFSCQLVHNQFLSISEEEQMVVSVMWSEDHIQVWTAKTASTIGKWEFKVECVNKHKSVSEKILEEAIQWWEALTHTITHTSYLFSYLAIETGTVKGLGIKISRIVSCSKSIVKRQQILQKH